MAREVLLSSVGGSGTRKCASHKVACRLKKCPYDETDFTNPDRLFLPGGVLRGFVPERADQGQRASSFKSKSNSNSNSKSHKCTGSSQGNFAVPA